MRRSRFGDRLGREKLSRSGKCGHASGDVHRRTEQVAGPPNDRSVIGCCASERETRFVPAGLQERAERADGRIRIGKRDHRLVTDPFDRRSVATERLAHHALEAFEHAHCRNVSIDIGNRTEASKIDEGDCRSFADEIRGALM